MPRDKSHSRKDHSHHMSNSIPMSLANSYNSDPHAIAISQHYSQYNNIYSPSLTANSFPPPIMDMEEDSDIQIVGMSPPMDSMVPGIKFGSGSGIKFGSVSSSMAGAAGANSSGAGKPLAGVMKLKAAKKAEKTQGTTSSSSDTLTSASGGGAGMDKEGCVVQCVELPSQVDSDQYVHSITPTLNASHVIVLTAPKCLNKNIYQASTNHANSVIMEEDEEEDEADEEAGEDREGKEGGEKKGTGDEASVTHPGCLIVYRVDDKSGSVCMLDETPVYVSDLDDSVIEVLMLPKEFSHSMDEEDALSPSASIPPIPQDSAVPDTHPSAASAATADNTTNTPAASSGAAAAAPRNSVLEGYVALTTTTGKVKIMQLSDFKVLATIKPSDGDKIVSATYCSSKCSLHNHDRAWILHYLRDIALWYK